MAGSPSTLREHALMAAASFVISCYGDYVSLSEACGDGQVAAGELCDDGNDIDGDGCNNDCSLAATEQWTRCIPSFVHPDVRANGAAFDSAGNAILVATIVSEDGGPAKTWTRSFDRDGGVRWTSVCCEDEADFVASAAGGPVVLTGDDLVLGGRVTGESLTDASLVLSLDARGDVLWQAASTDQEPILAITALARDRVFAAVEREGTPVLLGLGAKPWSRVVATASDGAFTARALELQGADFLYAAGAIEDGVGENCGWLGKYGNVSGLFSWQAEDGDARYLDLAVDPVQGLVYALAMAPCTGSAKTTIHRYTADGVRSSGLEFPAPRLDAAGLGLALDGEGRLTMLTADAGGPTLTRLAADGPTLWTAAVPQLTAQVLAVAPGGRIAVGGIQQNGEKIDVCLRSHTP